MQTRLPLLFFRGTLVAQFAYAYHKSHAGTSKFPPLIHQPLLELSFEDMLYGGDADYEDLILVADIGFDYQKPFILPH